MVTQHDMGLRKGGCSLFFSLYMAVYTSLHLSDIPLSDKFLYTCVVGMVTSCCMATHMIHWSDDKEYFS